MSTPNQMVAYQKSVEEICKIIGADSLQYLSENGLEEAVKQGLSEKRKENAGYCSACFTGKYPLKVDDW